VDKQSQVTAIFYLEPLQVRRGNVDFCASIGSKARFGRTRHYLAHGVAIVLAGVMIWPHVLGLVALGKQERKDNDETFHYALPALERSAVHSRQRPSACRLLRIEAVTLQGIGCVWSGDFGRKHLLVRQHDLSFRLAGVGRFHSGAVAISRN
jgi:hypothetical protein